MSLVPINWLDSNVLEIRSLILDYVEEFPVRFIFSWGSIQRVLDVDFELELEGVIREIVMGGRYIAKHTEYCPTVQLVYFR